MIGIFKIIHYLFDNLIAIFIFINSLNILTIIILSLINSYFTTKNYQLYENFIYKFKTTTATIALNI